MKEKNLYGIWIFLFILCAGLGFIPEPAGFGKGILVILSILCFLPGAVLLIKALEKGNQKTVLLIRKISAASLVLTLALLVANLLSVNAPSVVGDILYGLLAVVSAPMLCSQYWILSLFLWGCLLIGSFSRKKGDKT